MMELLTKSFDIRCEECGEIITVFCDGLDPDISFYDHGENGMGDETIYYIEDELECPCCDHTIKFSITGCEYPVGAYDYDGCEIVGGSFVEEPRMGMVYYQEEFDIDLAAVAATGIRELILRISRDKDLIYSVTPREFEEIVEQLFIDEGFTTTLTKSTRDGGKDIVATKTGINGKPIVFFVECKRYRQTNKVDVGIVRSLYGVQTSERINKACLVTSSHFTSEAVAFAESQNVMIDLVDGDALHDMIMKSARKYEDEFWRT